MTLFDYSAIEKRLNETDIYILIADCDAILAENPTEFMRLLRSALSLSAHVLEKDKSALAHQLAGRLYHHVDKNATIKAFVDGIIPPKNSLYPIYNGYDPLNPAGGMLVRIVKHPNDREKSFRAIVLSDGRILSYGIDLHLWDSQCRHIKTLEETADYQKKAVELQNGSFVAIGISAKDIHLWDKEGQYLATLSGHQKWVHNILELRDGCILSLGDDRTMRLWASDGTLLKLFSSESFSSTHAIELHDGRILSWSTNNYDAWIWDRDTGLVHTLIGHRGYVYGARQLANHHILTWSYDNTLRLWDENGHLVSVFTGHTKFVSKAIELRNEHILSWSADDTLRLWDKSGTLLKTISEHHGIHPHVLQLHNGNIVSNGFLDILQFWDEKLNPIKTIDIRTRGLYICKFRMDCLLAHYSNGSLQFLNNDGDALSPIYNISFPKEAILELKNGCFMLIDFSDSAFALWDTRENHDVDAKIAHQNWIDGLTTLDGGVISWGADGSMYFWDEFGQPMIEQPIQHDIEDNLEESLWVKPDGGMRIDRLSFLYTSFKDDVISWSDNDDFLKFCDGETGNPIHIFYGDSKFTSVAVLGDIIIAGDEMGRVIFLRWVE